MPRSVRLIALLLALAASLLFWMRPATGLVEAQKEDGAKVYVLTEVEVQRLGAALVEREEAVKKFADENQKLRDKLAAGLGCT